MHIKNLVSPIAVSVALSFAGGASAQTSVGGMEVSAEDLPRVESYCASLASMETDSLTETGGDDGDDNVTGAGTGTDDGEDDEGEAGPNDDESDDGADRGDTADTEADPAAEDGEASDMSNALTAVDLDVLTIADCREAGLID